MSGGIEGLTSVDCRLKKMIEARGNPPERTVRYGRGRQNEYGECRMLNKECRMPKRKDINYDLKYRKLEVRQRRICLGTLGLFRLAA